MESSSDDSKVFEISKHNNISGAGNRDVAMFNYNNIRKAAMILRALNHPLRQKMFNFLAENENSTVSDIILYFNIEQSIISQHLAILRRAKIIYNLKNGKFVHYYINRERVAEVKSFISSILEDSKGIKIIPIEEKK
ncbi:MAG: metalloregulator ArsR/SmtB family transcription factor [Ginsengibacter sp.]